MREPRSYIVRIYRQGFRTLAGVVEDTHSGAAQPFRNTEELLALVRAPIPMRPPPRRRRSSNSTR